MSRAEKIFCAILDLLFVAMVGVLFLLLFLRYVSKEGKLVVDSNNDLAEKLVNTASEFPVSEGEAQAAQSIEETVVDGTEAASRVTEREDEQNEGVEDIAGKAEAYCVKCRERREMRNASKVVTKNGRNALEGICPVCGTKLFRFIAR